MTVTIAIIGILLALLVKITLIYALIKASSSIGKKTELPSSIRMFGMGTCIIAAALLWVF